MSNSDHPDSDLLSRIVEQLEMGVFVYDGKSRRVVYANASAVTFLRAFGDRDALGPLLQETVSRSLADSEPGRFPRATPVASDGGARFYLRAKYLSPGASHALVSVAPHVPRERELRDLLRHRFGLSPREVDIVRSLRGGATNEQIASELGLSVGTVKQSLSRVFATLGVQNRTQLVSMLENIAGEDAPASSR